MYRDLSSDVNLWTHGIVLVFLWVHDVQGFVCSLIVVGCLKWCMLRWLDDLVGRYGGCRVGWFWRWRRLAEGHFQVNWHTIFGLQSGCDAIVRHLQHPGNPQRLCGVVCLRREIHQASSIIWGGRRGGGCRRLSSELQVPAFTWRLKLRRLSRLLWRRQLRCCGWYSADKRLLFQYQLHRLLASNKNMQCEFCDCWLQREWGRKLTLWRRNYFFNFSTSCI